MALYAILAPLHLAAIVSRLAVTHHPTNGWLEMHLGAMTEERLCACAAALNDPSVQGVLLTAMGDASNGCGSDAEIKELQQKSKTAEEEVMELQEVCEAPCSVVVLVKQ